MKRFYIIKPKNENDPYEVTIFLANNFQDTEILCETHFAASQNVDIRLLSVDESESDYFERTLFENEYSFEEKKLWEEYKQWKGIADSITESCCNNDVGYQGEKILISEYEIPEIIETSNGKQLLTEGEISRKGQIRIYVRSNEEAPHSTPHVHVDYADIDNAYVISLKDFSVIKPKNDRGAKIKKVIELLEKDIVKARLAWNKSTGYLKFKLDEQNIPINETIEH